MDTVSRVAVIPACCSTATAGFPAPEMVVSSTVSRPSPLRQIPLPAAVVTEQARARSTPASATTMPDVPRSPIRQASSTPPTGEVTTTPAPTGLRTSHSRISTLPWSRTNTVDQADACSRHSVIAS